MNHDTTRREMDSRAAAIVFGILTGLLLVEALLQFGALYVRLSGADPTDFRFREGSVRLLALGDSNTYGLYLEDRAKHAYPRVLEALWQQRRPDYPIQVINVGVPGTNSSRLRRELPRLLETFQPDVVTFMIGVNDFWTEPVPLDDEHKSESLAWRVSRLYRLLRMLHGAFDQATVEIEFSNPEGYRPKRGTVRYDGEEFALGWTRRAEEGVSRWTRLLVENLDAILKATRAAGAKAIFLTYASEQKAYGRANDTIRAWAARAGVSIADSRPRLSPLCPRGDCEDLYYPSLHPTKKAHAILGQVLFEELADIEARKIGDSSES